MAYVFDWVQKEKQAPKLDESGLATSEMITRPPIFEGFVRVRIPSHEERLRFVKAVSVQIVNGEAVSMSGYDQGIEIMAFAKKHIEAVALKRKDDGLELKSLDDLDHDLDGAEVLSDIGAEIAKGVRLKKS
jgi:hypothetical protein